MNPYLGRWLKLRAGEEVGPPTAQHVLGLQDTFRKLRAIDGDSFQHHDAGEDARATWAIYLKLLQICVSKE